jgi:uncharacterized membrane protein YhaH (DUF805 family)
MDSVIGREQVVKIAGQIETSNFWYCLIFNQATNAIRGMLHKVTMDAMNKTKRLSLACFATLREVHSKLRHY